MDAGAVVHEEKKHTMLCVMLPNEGSAGSENAGKLNDNLAGTAMDVPSACVANAPTEESSSPTWLKKLCGCEGALEVAYKGVLAKIPMTMVRRNMLKYMGIFFGCMGKSI